MLAEEQQKLREKEEKLRMEEQERLERERLMIEKEKELKRKAVNKFKKFNHITYIFLLLELLKIFSGRDRTQGS